jgi:RNA polymerase sigma factor (sigma-70 family)
MGGFQGRAAFLTWLLRVARSAAADQGRAQQRRRRDQDTDPPVRSEPDPAADLEHLELTEAVRQAVRRLPETERAAITLCELQEMPIAEAVDILGCSEILIKSALFRARGRLRVMLAKHAG